MNPIQFTALLLGIVILLTRLPGLVYPKKIMRWVRDHFINQDDGHMRFYGFSIAIASALLIYLLTPEVEWLEAITLMLVLTMLVWGCITLFFPDISRSTIRSYLRQSVLSVRILCGIAVVLAIYLIKFGLQ